MFLLLFVVLGFVLVGLGRFADHMMRTRGGWLGALALLPLLVAFGVIAGIFVAAL